jgi:hypothetical protein
VPGAINEFSTRHGTVPDTLHRIGQCAAIAIFDVYSGSVPLRTYCSVLGTSA